MVVEEIESSPDETEPLTPLQLYYRPLAKASQVVAGKGVDSVLRTAVGVGYAEECPRFVTE